MISPKVMVELHQAKLVPTQFTVTKPGEHAWSAAEQRRFWDAIHRFPQGPWTAIAAYVGSKSTRQAMTHAQKLRQKLNRWKRRVRHNNDDTTLSPTASASGANSPRSVANDYDELDDDGDYDDSAFDSESTCSVKYEDDVTTITTTQQSLAVELPLKAPSSLSPDDVAWRDDDAYFEHLLSDIEPMLETVVNFASPQPQPQLHEYAAQYYSNSSSAAFPVPSYALASVNTSTIQHNVAGDALQYSALSMQSYGYASRPSAYVASIDFRL